MPGMNHRVLACLWLAAGCRDGGPEAPAPSPWAALPFLPADPFAPVMETGFQVFAEGTMPTRLVSVPLIPSVAALDVGSGVVLAMDGRYQHGAVGACVPLFDTVLPDDGVDRRGPCGADRVWLQRGAITASAPIRAVASDPARSRLLALDARGGWWTANVDLDEGEPADWLRPLDAGTDPGFPGTDETDTGSDDTGSDDTGAAETVSTAGVLAVSAEGQVAATFDDVAWLWPSVGAPGVAHPLGAGATDVVFWGEVPVIATDDGVRWGVDGPVLPLGGTPARLAAAVDGVWATVTGADRLVLLDAAGTARIDVSVPGLTGPFTLDPDGRAFVAVTDGVAVVTEGVETARHLGESPLDLVAQPSGELVLLRDGGRVDIRFDETTLKAGAPLAVSVATFFENPKKRTERIPCGEGDPNLRAYLDAALANRAWLDDVPAAILFGVTPTVARQVVTCGFEDDLHRVVDVPRTEVGVLFHEAPKCEADDQPCVDASVADEAQAFEALELAPTWSSGAAAWDLEGTDWIESVLLSGLPPRHLFFGQAARPDVMQADLHSKEALPWAGVTPLTGWTESSDAGSLDLYPGMPISGFILGDCPNLLSLECGRVDAGGGATFEARDLQVLSLLLRRALYVRSADGPDTWYFHLPALELYEYTAGCTRGDDGVWSGETCEAGLLQAWLFDVHARFVLGGLVAWALPSSLAPAPG